MPTVKQITFEIMSKISQSISKVRTRGHDTSNAFTGVSVKKRIAFFSRSEKSKAVNSEQSPQVSTSCYHQNEHDEQMEGNDLHKGNKVFGMKDDSQADYNSEPSLKIGIPNTFNDEVTLRNKICRNHSASKRHGQLLHNVPLECGILHKNVVLRVSNSGRVLDKRRHAMFIGNSKVKNESGRVPFGIHFQNGAWSDIFLRENHKLDKSSHTKEIIKDIDAVMDEQESNVQTKYNECINVCANENTKVDCCFVENTNEAQEGLDVYKEQIPNKNNDSFDFRQEDSEPEINTAHPSVSSEINPRQQVSFTEKVENDKGNIEIGTKFSTCSATDTLDYTPAMIPEPANYSDCLEAEDRGDWKRKVDYKRKCIIQKTNERVNELSNPLHSDMSSSILRFQSTVKNQPKGILETWLSSSRFSTASLPSETDSFVSVTGVESLSSTLSGSSYISVRGYQTSSDRRDESSSWLFGMSCQASLSCLNFFSFGGFCAF